MALDHRTKATLALDAVRTGAMHPRDSPGPTPGWSRSLGRRFHTLHSRRYFAPQRRLGAHWRAGPRAPAAHLSGARVAGAERPRPPVCVGWTARARASTMSANGSAATEPRLCHVRKAADFDGYGFNLHAEKGKPGQYIGKVDDGSPAAAAGLRRGDRILEVNGHSIAGETHKQVVARIKERPDDAELLVAAPAPGDPLPELGPDPAAAPAAPASPAPAAAPAPALNLPMTVAEMRAQLAAKKKVDPKKVPMDLKSKFDIVKKL